MWGGWQMTPWGGVEGTFALPPGRCEHRTGHDETFSPQSVFTPHCPKAAGTAWGIRTGNRDAAGPSLGI